MIHEYTGKETTWSIAQKQKKMEDIKEWLRDMEDRGRRTKLFKRRKAIFKEIELRIFKI